MRKMDIRLRKMLALIMVSTMLLAGCLGGTTSNHGSEITDELQGPTDPLDNDTDSSENGIIKIEGSNFCDDTNHIHCMLPFPSGAFLDVDETQDTGYRLSIDGEAIPDTRSSVSDNMVILDRLDGFSPSTQIFTAFDEVCLLYTSPSPRDRSISRMPSSA